jgi:hypothetical protein
MFIRTVVGTIALAWAIPAAAERVTCRTIADSCVDAPA